MVLPKIESSVFGISLFEQFEAVRVAVLLVYGMPDGKAGANPTAPRR
jgi:hypothetical protein